MGSRLLGVHGQVQREGDVIHVIAERLTDLSSMLSKLGDQQCLFPVRFGRGDGPQNGWIRAAASPCLRFHTISIFRRFISTRST
jgi:hypothetical protein